MKYARVDFQGTPRWATLHDNRFHLLDASPYDGGRPEGTELTVQEVRLLAPVTPSKIFCLGRNYADHRAEMGYAHDGTPSVFMKGPSTIIGPGENIVLPPRRLSTHVEHEAELAIVVGKTARFVSAEMPMTSYSATPAPTMSAPATCSAATHIQRAARGSTRSVPSDRGSKPISTQYRESACAAA